MTRNQDITSNFHGGNAESEAAHELNKKAKSQQHSRIIALAGNRGEYGTTADEASNLLNMDKTSSVSARFSELKKAGILIPTKKRRITRNGGSATVFVLAEAKD